MLKVLVVEDEEMIRKGIILTVDWAAIGCAVVGEASNGSEGLEAAKRLEPNLIITDVKMPLMDGLEMVRRLRKDGCNAYVIFLTAYDHFAYVQSALRMGAVDYILKPFHDGELEQTIARLQENSGVKPASPIPPTRKGDKSKYVMEAMTYIREHYNDPDISVGSVAQSLNISEGYLSHTFKKETDNTMLNYLTRYRIHKAMELLKDCRVKVYEVAEQVGYRDIAYFSATFKRYTGISPSEYQGTVR